MKNYFMNVLILTQWYSPEPPFKSPSLATELKKRGHKVQVLTGFPNYPEGKIYSGYRIRLVQREIIDDIDVIRVPLFPSHDCSPFKRMLNYLSFAFCATVIGLWLIKKSDILYVYHPPATVAIPAIFIKVFRRIPIVYDIQDLWPDTLESTGMLSGKIISIIGVFCRISYKYFDRIVVLSPGFKKKLIERGVVSNRIEIIYNWSDLKLEQSVVNNKNIVAEMQSKFVFLFAGNMGKAQALDSLLDAAFILKNRGYENILLVLVGDGIEKDRLVKKKNDSGLDNVIFVDRVGKVEIVGILKSANVLVVHLKNDELFEITIPSKLQSYMLIGKPILMGVKGDAASLIKNSGGGIVCEPENPLDIAEKMLYMYKCDHEKLVQMGINSMHFYKENMELSLGARKIEDLFYEIINCKH